MDKSKLIICIIIFFSNIYFNKFFINTNKILKFKKNDIYEFERNVPKKEDIYKEYNFDSLSQSFTKAKMFLDNNMKGNLINNKSLFSFSQKPKVSVVVPIYNSQKYINKTIRSIQNQNLFNLEIILINDFSKDNTSSIINNFQEEDPRIKIIV